MTQRHGSRRAPRRLPLGRLVFGVSLLLPLLPAAITWAAEVEVPRTFNAIGAGSATSCAIDSDGDLRCWGDGSMGALGTGSTAIVGSGAATAMRTSSRW